MRLVSILPNPPGIEVFPRNVYERTFNAGTQWREFVSIMSDLIVFHIYIKLNFQKHSGKLYVFKTAHPNKKHNPNCSRSFWFWLPWWVSPPSSASPAYRLAALRRSDETKRRAARCHHGVDDETEEFTGQRTLRSLFAAKARFVRLGRRTKSFGEEICWDSVGLVWCWYVGGSWSGWVLSVLDVVVALLFVLVPFVPQVMFGSKACKVSMQKNRRNMNAKHGSWHLRWGFWRRTKFPQICSAELSLPWNLSASFSDCIRSMYQSALAKVKSRSLYWHGHRGCHENSDLGRIEYKMLLKFSFFGCSWCWMAMTWPQWLCLLSRRAVPIYFVQRSRRTCHVWHFVEGEQEEDRQEPSAIFEYAQRSFAGWVAKGRGLPKGFWAHLIIFVVAVFSLDS